MATDLSWKTKIDDLRNRAESVARASSEAAMSPRTAARCLAGICGHIARRFSLDEMQRTCAELVMFLGRAPETWVPAGTVAERER